MRRSNPLARTGPGPPWRGCVCNISEDALDEILRLTCVPSLSWQSIIFLFSCLLYKKGRKERKGRKGRKAIEKERRGRCVRCCSPVSRAAYGEHPAAIAFDVLVCPQLEKPRVHRHATQRLQAHTHAQTQAQAQHVSCATCHMPHLKIATCHKMPHI